MLVIVSHDRYFSNVSIASNKCWRSLAMIRTLLCSIALGHSSFMHCDLHWGRVLRNRQFVHSLLNQRFVSCGSTNYTASWVTGFSGDFSAVLVVNELRWQAVDRRCCKRPSRLRNWSICTHATFTRRTASELITVHCPKPLLPSSGPFQESSILHILDAQRVCSVSLTNDSANLCSLLQEYHRIFWTHCCRCWAPPPGNKSTETTKQNC